MSAIHHKGAAVFCADASSMHALDMHSVCTDISTTLSRGTASRGCSVVAPEHGARVSVGGREGGNTAPVPSDSETGSPVLSSLSSAHGSFFFACVQCL